MWGGSNSIDVGTLNLTGFFRTYDAGLGVTSGGIYISGTGILDAYEVGDNNIINVELVAKQNIDNERTIREIKYRIHHQLNVNV
jgi:hypothetical protein